MDIGLTGYAPSIGVGCTITPQAGSLLILPYFPMGEDTSAPLWRLS